MGFIRTIPQDEPFLDALIGGLLSEPPERLADTTLLLPSRRACLAARDAFLRLAEGRPMLLPDLKPIGEPDEAELFLDPRSALELPPLIEPLARRLLLTRLLLARDATMTVEQAIRLAGDLTTLLDELQNEEVELGRLEELVPEAYAEHWQSVLRFLRLLGEAWPALLDDLGVAEPASRRRRLLDGVVRRWAERPPGGRIIAAGVTGTIPAVARLLQAILRLPEGALVLPGLDLGLSEASWQALGPTHPQFALKRLLDCLAVDRAAVEPWPHSTGRTSPSARLDLWRAVTNPAPAAEPLPPPSAEALRGLTVEQAPDATSEALRIALRLRANLEVPGKTAMLVTPDRTLARRVGAELARWDVTIDDSAGIPLDQSPPGTFLLLTAHLLAEAATPSMMLAALKHPLTRGGMDQGEFRRHVRVLERACLRGPRPSGGLGGLPAAIPDPASWRLPIPRAELLGWLRAIVARGRPFQVLVASPGADLSAMLEAHLAFAEWLASDGKGDCGELWAKDAGREAQSFLGELRQAASILAELPASAYPALLAVLMGDRQVRLQHRTHPRLAILGQFESRLVSADLVVLGGLVEGVWPGSTEAGPWLNRAMRRQLGMPLVEERIGVAAHDLAMAGGAAEVVLSLAAKDHAGSPTIKSRWLARLEALMRAAGRSDALAPDPGWAAWAEQLDEPREPGWPHPRPQPRPCPPLAKRPRKLWVTDIETLLRNPYGVYARRILELRPIDPIDADPGHAERGQLVHRALQIFVERYPEELPEAPLIELIRLGGALFAEHAHHPQVMAIWWPRFLRIAEWFVAMEIERRREIARIRTELTGLWEIEGLPGGPIAIQARADRVEVGRDNRLTLVDYKTGSAPNGKEVRLGRSPQLPLEGLIAAAGGFPDLPAGDPAALLYFQLKGGEPAGEATAAGGKTADLAELLAAAKDGLWHLLDHFDDPGTAYIVRPRPAAAASHDDYEHLARVAEWRGVEEG